MSVQKIAMVRKLALGGATFTGLPSRLENRESSEDAASGMLDGNIGMGILNRFHLIVDFPHNRVLFAPPIDTSTPFRVNHSGLTLRPGVAGSTILHVADGSPAARAGLAVGEVIQSIDGKPVSDDGSDGEWQYGPLGDNVRLRLTDGTVRTIKLASYF